MSLPKVYIVVLNYNGFRDSQECLESLLKLGYGNYQIVFVDNDSPNDSMRQMVSWANGESPTETAINGYSKYALPPARKPVGYVLYSREDALSGGIPNYENKFYRPLVFIQSGENRGFSSGNNVGIKYALSKGDADYIWCLNNDTVVSYDSLSALVGVSTHYKSVGSKVGIVGSKLCYYDRPEIIQAVGGRFNKYTGSASHVGFLEEDLGQYDSFATANLFDYPVGASLFVDVEFIKDVGLMCEEYFLYYEELDWVTRGKERGWSVGYCWDAKILHKEGGSVGSSYTASTISKQADFYLLRSRILYTQKFQPKRLWLVRLSFFTIFASRVRRRRWDLLFNAWSVLLGKKKPGST